MLALTPVNCVASSNAAHTRGSPRDKRIREMPLHQFTLIVDGPDLQDASLIDAVFEAGCGDAAAGRIDGVQYVDFDREALTLDQAILSAVVDLERIDGLRVVRIADAGLVSMADIAVRIGRTREGVRLMITGARGPGGFPPPITDPRSRYRLWRWSDVALWLTRNLGEEMSDANDEILAALNAGLELRHHRRRLARCDHAKLDALAEL